MLYKIINAKAPLNQAFFKRFIKISSPFYSKIAFKILLCFLAFVFWAPLFLSFNNLYINAIFFIFLVLSCVFIKKYRGLKELIKVLGLLVLIVIFSLLHKNINVLVSFYYVVSIFIFLSLDREFSFLFGFFVGIIGFYWIPFSFRFFEISFLIPFVVLLIGLAVGVIFFFLMYFNSMLYRILALCFLTILHPLGFNWLNVNYFSAFSVFSPTLFGLICISLAIFFMKFKGKPSFLLFIILFSFDYNFFKVDSGISNNIFLSNTDISQDQKWDNTNLINIVNANFSDIYKAINQSKNIIVLPETAFPFVLLNNPQIVEFLQDLSEQITIVAGALRAEDNKIFNTNFIFSKRKITPIDKVKLVPFGENLPLSSLRQMFEKFGFSFNMSSSDTYKSFVVDINNKILTFTNAICYEVTTKEPYLLEKKPSNNFVKIFNFIEQGLIRDKNINFMIANSNNAWFSPSLQEQFQKMIIKYYARHYNYFVFHSANSTKSYIISPNNGPD